VILGSDDETLLLVETAKGNQGWIMLESSNKETRAFFALVSLLFT
jgi:hypothetical protein